MNICRVAESDAARALEVRRAVLRGDTMDLEHYCERLQVPTRLDVLAEVDGRAVGVAHAMRDVWQSESGHAFANCGVLPAFRRRGIGSALMRTISEHAATLGCIGLTLPVAEDEAGARAFLEHRGYRETGRMQHVELALEEIEEPALSSLIGIEIRPLRVGEEEQLYDVARDAEADTPLPSGAGSIEVQPFDDWRKLLLGQAFPGYEHSFVATADGVIVGYAALGRGAEGVAWHTMTAVRPAWRGRGIAVALKQAQIRSAKLAGLTTLAAVNSENNPAMKAVNARLGYRSQPAVLHYRGPLQTR